MSNIYESIYSQDNKEGENYGWIQWKGTEVCIDIHCHCGHHGHFDGDFFYYYECPECKTKYAVGANIKLIPLNGEQIEYAKSGIGFKTTNINEINFKYK